MKLYTDSLSVKHTEMTPEKMEVWLNFLARGRKIKEVYYELDDLLGTIYMGHNLKEEYIPETEEFVQIEFSSVKDYHSTSVLKLLDGYHIRFHHPGDPEGKNSHIIFGG